MNKKTFVIIGYGLLFVFSHLNVRGQSLNLSDVLQKAQSQSSQSLIAKHRFLESYWEYQSYKAGNLPSLTLGGTLPSFSRAITKVTQPDGSQIFTPQSLSSLSAEMKISQPIPWTGGEVFLSSGLERLDIFGVDRSTSYLSTPILFGISQPLFTYNEQKWDKKIEPVKYDLAKQTYLESMQQIFMDAVELYFILLEAQVRLDNALSHKSQTDTLFYIAAQGYQAGKIAESEYLQVELSSLDAALQIEICKNKENTALLNLKTFLNANDTSSWRLSIPQNLREIHPDENTACEQARENQPIYHDFRQRELAAQSDIARAKTENRFNVNIYATVGLSQDGANIDRAYKNPMDQEIVNVGFHIPILDWGRAKGRIKVAKSQQEVVNTQIYQEEREFEQNLRLKITQYRLQKSQLSYAQRAMEIAQKRFEVESQRYLIGKTDFTNLNIAISDKDKAITGYIDALRQYWMLFYEIRKLCLFDYETNEKIEVDYRELIK